MIMIVNPPVVFLMPPIEVSSERPTVVFRNKLDLNSIAVRVTSIVVNYNLC